ncbi:hypothetical protein BOX15_Mlig006309g1 [Macrostomum lignano]|uniref:Uncharacterized protein n=2 Tax=Macrostomum lignano TaxID=282301 RepID=A0A267EME8_9PLAT|nr:hypothetical protein BOX15_Mlig022851g4 [Macrostomum lignano]PAA76268.1 hypothetical protein BOX15_Mlig006309g1 [Macrostomum lignano]
MPAYHSEFVQPPKLVGNMALLPLRTKFRGPAPQEASLEKDIIDEALFYFKANVFFKNYEIKSEADRVLIYLTLYILDVLKKVHRCQNKNQAAKEINAMGIAKFDIPGDPGFPRELNAMYAKPRDRAEDDAMRQYIQQLRQETGQRLLERLFPGNPNEKPSKWWICFSKRKFMDQTLTRPGQAV